MWQIILLRRCGSTLFRSALLFCLAIIFLASRSAIAEPVSAAYFGMTFVQTSLEPTSTAERERLVMVEDRLRAQLEAAGAYTFVDIAPVSERLAHYENPSHCNGCDTTFAEELGAAVAISGEIQKTSNLILHISIYVREAGTARLIGGGSADIRSNTDESWRRGVDYIVKNRILRQ
ncbi:MAG: DUF3280 domain-containing protein [Pseudomonadota bacterium]